MLVEMISVDTGEPLLLWLEAGKMAAPAFCTKVHID